MLEPTLVKIDTSKIEKVNSESKLFELHFGIDKSDTDISWSRLILVVSYFCVLSSGRWAVGESLHSHHR